MTNEPANTAAKLDPQAIRARKRRNIWLGLALFAFVVLMAWEPRFGLDKVLVQTPVRPRFTGICAAMSAGNCPTKLDL